MKPPAAIDRGLKALIGAVNRSTVQPMAAMLLVSALLVAGHLVEELREGDTMASDTAILLAFRTPGHLATPIGPPSLLQSAIDISALGGFTVIWLLTLTVAGFLVLTRRWRQTIILLAAIGGASLLSSLIKVSFHRARPAVVPHLAEVTSASFPSGHAMISAAAYLTIGAMLARTQTSRAARWYLMTLAVILILLIGTTRVYLGVHWPSDVAAGWCFGAAWALAFQLIGQPKAPPERPAS